MAKDYGWFELGIFLWLIIISLVFILAFVIFHIGWGRWECVENKATCAECNLQGSIPTDLGIVINWTTDNPKMCYCTKLKTECVKSVWTYNGG